MFAGVYGVRWVDNLIASVESQEANEFEVVAALNGPDDGAAERLVDWQRSSRHSITVVINSRNLGPAGSLYLNCDLMRSPWLATFHQDDVYLPHHIATVTRVAEGAAADTLAIFTTMEGITEDGRKIAGPPVRNAYLDGAGPEVTLPAIIRRHPFPTPVATVRNPGGLITAMPWFDSGAPDSEWFAYLACRGRFRVLPDVTAYYRQPVTSQSSTTGWESRAWQWANSLNRILLSDDFVALLGDLSPSARAQFASDLLAAIPARYPQSPLFDFLRFVAAQQMSHAWRYEAGPQTEKLLADLLAAGPSAATANLEDLLGSSAIEASALPVARLLGGAPRPSRSDDYARDVYRRVGRYLPHGVREWATGTYQRVRGRRGVR